MKRIGPAAFALLAFLSLVGLPAHAADNANDGNTHDTRDGAENPEEEDTEGNPDDDCHSSSPVLIESGEFIWADTDVTLAGRPTLSLTRYYRSFDSREGIFGKGWSTRCEKALVRVLDYEPSDPDDPASASVARVKYVHRLANGRRYAFVETAPDEFSAPAGLPGLSLTLDAERTPTLTRLDGSTERYDALGLLVAETDRNGNDVLYEYEGGALSRIADTHGRFLALGYDSTGHVASVTDHTGREWRYAYGADGTLESVIDPAGGVRRYAYADVTRAASEQVYPAITSVTDESGTPVIGVTYDDIGKVASYTVGTNTYTYSVRRGFVYKTDSLGAGWSYATDESGHKSEVYPPVSTSVPERYEYDANGNVIRHTDLAGTEHSQAFDAVGRLLSTTTPDGTTTIDYVENTSWPATMTSATGRVVRVAHDERGNPTSVTDPGGNVTRMRWSPAGDLLAVTDALGNVSTRAVDAIGLVTSVTDPLDRTVSFAYDTRGNLVTVTDALGGTTTLEHDVLDRLVATTDALGRRTAQTYDAAGRLTSVTDPAGGVTTLAHDAVGRLATETRPDGSEIAYAYREDNLLETSTDPNGTVTTFAYDRGRRLTSVSAGSTRYTYAYDVLGRVTSAASRDATVRFEYDVMHRPVSETQGNTTVRYAYDAEGELVSMEALGEELLYEHDERGLLASFTTPSGVHRYAYDAVGRMVSHTLPNGAVATMAHDAAGQLVEQDYAALGGDRYTYAHDALGRVVRIGGDGPVDRLYAYDAIGRLTGAQGQRSHAYTYDALGNRLEDGGVYNAFNQLLENDAFDYAYDAAGALTSRVSKGTGEQTRYTYDALRRLTRVETAAAADGLADSTVDFGYDAFGRRVSKRADGTTTTFRWAGSDLLSEYVGNTLTGTYRYDGAYAAAEFTDTDGTWFVQSNHLDTPRSLVDAGGTRYAVDDTDPYGALVDPTSSVAGAPVFNQRFPGQYFDRETGLSYNRYRYYDPTTGRYTRDDPIGLRGGTNAYAYSEQDPVNGMDPTGELAWFLVPILGGAISGGIDLGLQLWLNDGDWSCVSWGSVAGSAAVGAVAASFGPGGFVAGRSANAAGRFGGSYPGRAGLLNRGNTRIGWSWNRATGRQHFSVHGGRPRTPSHWHRDTPLSLPAGDFNTRFAIGGGVVGGAVGGARGAGAGDCGVCSNR